MGPLLLNCCVEAVARGTHAQPFALHCRTPRGFLIAVTSGFAPDVQEIFENTATLLIGQFIRVGLTASGATYYGLVGPIDDAL